MRKHNKLLTCLYLYIEIFNGQIFLTEKNIDLFVALITENVSEPKIDFFPTNEKRKLLSKHHKS